MVQGHITGQNNQSGQYPNYVQRNKKNKKKITNNKNK